MRRRRGRGRSITYTWVPTNQNAVFMRPLCQKHPLHDVAPKANVSFLVNKLGNEGPAWVVLDSTNECFHIWRSPFHRNESFRRGRLLQRRSHASRRMSESPTRWQGSVWSMSSSSAVTNWSVRHCFVLLSSTEWLFASKQTVLKCYCCFFGLTLVSSIYSFQLNVPSTSMAFTVLCFAFFLRVHVLAQCSSLLKM